MECKLCGKRIKQYQGRKRTRCSSCNTKIRRIRAKQAAIEFLGGKCARCGYDEHPAGLEFHHVGDKDFAIGDVANKSWGVLKQELVKCELLCSICHRIEHSNRTEQKWLDEAKLYKGRLLA